MNLQVGKSNGRRYLAIVHGYRDPVTKDEKKLREEEKFDGNSSHRHQRVEEERRGDHRNLSRALAYRRGVQSHEK
ncbi:MAG: hypothetical protein STSR0004_13920 [Peptococcaceae bacterium]